jgi:isoleucyl-tRNA synthetase
MDYKSTLNLPQTDFPMRANLPQREPERVAAWQRGGLYERMLARRADAPSFVLHDGPPYANGNIHIGHALNKVLKDIIVKSRTLAGFRSPYRPGWDCHGLPIELEVEKKLGRKADVDVIEVRRRCRDYASRFVDVQREEFERLGVLGDWRNPYLTLDPHYEAREMRELAAMIAGGGVYRGFKPVHWCASCRTALAEAEVEYDDHRSTSVYVAFPVKNPAGPLAPFADRELAIAIWTTTPWTLPANLAIAVHPQYTYALVERGERGAVVVAEAMVEALRERLGLGKVLATFPGSSLERLEARHPWIDRASLVITGDHVTLEAGTGCVHTAPGHGHDDYVVGQRYDLATYAPVDDRGRFTADVPEFEGTFVFAADEPIIELLAARGALLAREEVDHSYPHCWRCKKSIIFRATAQWFVSMEHAELRRRSLAAIDGVAWVPSWGRERIHGMIANRPDWCLSRQRSWGVPMVAVRCSGCAEATTSEALALKAAELFEREGSDAWFTHEVSDIVPEGLVCAGCGGSDFERQNDILDVWFDSGISFSAVVEADYGSSAVADLYLEGSDQHRGWFHSALLTSVATRARAPYRSVLTHGFVLDGKGYKMSKSLGNVVAPQAILQQYGADILRLWVAAEDYRDDVRISGEILKRLADSYRRVRNTARNLLGNLHDFAAERDAVAVGDMPELDRWALGRLDAFITRCRKAYDDYEFHVVYHALNNFCSVDLSALYFDIVKDRLYCSATTSRERRSAQTVMHHMLAALATLIAPILSFTAEEIWQAIPGNASDDSVFLADFPVVPGEWHDPACARRWERIWEIRAEVTKALEDARKAGSIGHSLDARVCITANESDRELLVGLGAEAFADVCIVSQVEVADGGGEGGLSVDVLEPLGTKCGRCWKFDPAVGSLADHPELCSRCHAVVALA